MLDATGEEIVRAFYEAQLDDDLSDRRTFGEGRHGISGPERPFSDWAAARQVAVNMLAQGEFSSVAGIAKDGYERAGKLPEVRQLQETCEGLLRALLEAFDRGAERDRGIFFGEPKDPLIASLLRSSQPSSVAATNATPPSAVAIVAEETAGDPDIDPKMAALTMTELAERCIAEKSRGPRPISAKSVEDYRKSAALFDRVTGNLPVGKVIRQHTQEYKSLLLELPTRFKTVFKTDDPFLAIKRNKEREKPLPTIDVGTINNKYLSNIRSIIEYGRFNGAIIGNPAEKLSVLTAKNQSVYDDRYPFNEGQLERIFNIPLFVGARSEHYVNSVGHCYIRDYRYWTPILAILTGARLNELGGLEVRDVRVVKGVNCIYLVNTEDPEENGRDNEKYNTEKSGKSLASRRIIPIHDELIRLGFLDYVNDIKSHGHVRLFPDWNIGADGYYSSPASKFYQRQLGLAKAKTDKTCFHSFRHNFKNGLRALDIKDDFEDYLMGHSNSSVSMRYGSPEAFLKFAPAIKSMDIEGLNLSHLRVYRDVCPSETLRFPTNI